MKYLLMIPGPVEVPDEVIEAFNGQPVAHYGKEFRDLYLDTAERLSRLLGSTGQSFLMPGSGTTALEAIGASFCNAKKCLIINNGSFGDRIYEICSRYAFETEHILFEKGQVMDIPRVESAIKNNKFDLVWMVHVDTSVGILNPVKEISNIASKYGSMFFIDAIASSGIEEIEMDRWNIGGIATASQKGFSCPAGLGMLTLSEEILKKLEELPPPRSWYYDIRTWIDYFYKWNDWHPYPATLPTNTVKALSKSLEIIEDEGIKNRIAGYRTVSGKIINAFRILGLEPFIPEGHNAHGLTAISTLGKFDSTEFIEFMKEKFYIQLGSSLDKKMKPLVFRVGHMSSKQCLARNLISVLSGAGIFMKIKNFKVNLEESLNHLL